MDKRNFELIAKYIDNKKPYLQKVINFLENCPQLSDYINFEINNYYSEDIEEKIHSKFDFNSFYEKIKVL